VWVCARIGVQYACWSMLALISEFPNALLSKAATKRNLLCLQVFAEVQKVLR
jgi:hypothetical protein